MGCAFMWGEVTNVDAKRQEVTLHKLTRWTGPDRRRRECQMTDDRPYANTSPARLSKQDTVIKFDYCVVAAGCAYNKITHGNGESLWFPTVLDSKKKTSPWGHLDERTMEGRFAHIVEEHAKLMKLNEEKGTAVVAGAGFIGVEW